MLAPQKRHDDDLLPAIDRLFKRCHLVPRDLDAIGVSVGPGGFTGLRIAVSTAKMFAEALASKIIAVPSALVAAESYRGEGPIIVALSSKGDTCWCTRLERRDRIWHVVGVPQVTDADHLDLRGVEALLGDEHVPEDIARYCTYQHVQLVPPVFDPAACLAVAERMLAASDVVDPLVLQPLYPRQPEAVTIWERSGKTTGQGEA
jgi:tRNA threonylcarbamoyl adenosine modification protein YeaZ